MQKNARNGKKLVLLIADFADFTDFISAGKIKKQSDFACFVVHFVLFSVAKGVMHPGVETIHEIQFTRYEIRKFWVVLIVDFADWAGFFILAGIVVPRQNALISFFDAAEFERVVVKEKSTTYGTSGHL